MKQVEIFHKLKVWEKSHYLTLSIYKITENYPQHELYGLVSQMRRASVSVVANIVEGTKRQTSKDRKHFYIMSDTSLEELKYYIILSCDLKYLNNKLSNELMESMREVGRMLNGLKNCQ